MKMGKVNDISLNIHLNIDFRNQDKAMKDERKSYKFFLSPSFKKKRLLINIFFLNNKKIPKFNKVKYSGSSSSKAHVLFSSNLN